MNSIMAGPITDIGPIASIAAVIFMIVFWVLPIVLVLFFVKKRYEYIKLYKPNSWIAHHGRKVFFGFVAVVPTVYIAFGIYGIVDKAFTDRRREKYDRCVAEKEEINEKDIDSCRHFLKKKWGF